MKKLIAIALVMILIGIAMVVVGLATGAVTEFYIYDDDMDEIDDFDEEIVHREYAIIEEEQLDYEEQEMIFNDLNKTDLEMDVAAEHYDISIVKGDADEIKLVYEKVEYEGEILHALDCQLEDRDHLEVHEKARNDDLRDSKAERAPKLTIYMPKNMKDYTFDEVNLNIDDNSLVIENMDFNDIEIESLGGDIKIQKNYWKSGSIDTLSGTIDIVDSQLERTGIDVADGELTLKNTKLENVKLDVLRGNIDGQVEIAGDNEIDNEKGSVYLELANDRDSVAIINEDGLETISVDEEVFTDSDSRLEDTIEIESRSGIVELKFK